MQYESEENIWEDVGEQQSITEIFQSLKHNSIYFWT